MPLVARHVRGRMQAELDQISLFDGVVGALEGLSAAGVTLAVVTSNSEANVRRMLGPRLAKRISHYACGVSIFGKRPRMLQAVRSAGVECAEAIAIGDEVRDAEAAHAAGIPFGAVAWGYTRLEALLQLVRPRCFGTRASSCKSSAGRWRRAPRPRGPEGRVRWRALRIVGWSG